MEIFFTSINTVACINAFLLSGLLILRRENSFPNKILAGLMFIPAIYFGNSILMLTDGMRPGLYFLFFIVQFTAIFYAPFVATYIHSILGQKGPQLKYIWTISLLIGIIPIYLGISFYGESTASQADFFHRLIKGPYPESVTFYSTVFYSFLQLVFIYYVFYLKSRIKEAKEVYSNLDRSKIVYLYNFALLLTILNFFIVLLYLVFDILFVEYILIPLIVGTIYTFIIYNAFRNNVVFTKDAYRVHLDQLEILPVKTRTMNGHKLDEAKINGIASKLQDSLEQEELIRNPSLSLKILSDHLEEKPEQISQCIKHHFNSNFYQIINRQRVQLSKSYLVENPQLTFEAIAYEVGFNSRATFYRAFKKETGQTPSDYLSEQKNLSH